MIVDADTHYIHDKPSIPSISPDGIVACMDRCGVDKAIVWPSSAYNRSLEPDNAVVGQALRRHPNRIIGFAHLNPRLGLKSNLDEVDRCMTQLGMRGFKFIPHLDEFAIDNKERVYPIIERAADHGAVIGIHTDIHYSAFCHPYQVGKVAAAFPNTQFLMVHIGKPAGVNAAIDIARQHSNISVIGSDIPEPFLVRKAIDALGADKVCFGSDTPFFSMRVTLAVYEEACEGLSDSDKALIMGGNLLRIVGQ